MITYKGKQITCAKRSLKNALCFRCYHGFDALRAIKNCRW